MILATSHGQQTRGILLDDLRFLEDFLKIEIMCFDLFGFKLFLDYFS